MCVSGLIIFIFSESIISIFSNDLEVIKFGSSYLKIAAFIGPIYPVFFISHALFTALKKTFLIFYSNLFRMVLFPLIITWLIIKVLGGYYNDIFYGLLIMNWIFGFIMLFIARGLMIKTFNEDKKVFFIFWKCYKSKFRWDGWAGLNHRFAKPTYDWKVVPRVRISLSPPN